MRKIFKKRNSWKSKLMKPCPRGGGYCLNPLCMFGCIDN